MIVFTLTMPNINTWNDSWSGQNKVFAKTRENRFVPKEIIDKSFYYNFGDGWGANINVEKMTAQQANKIMKKSSGFMGYDWMIDSIIKYNKIINSQEQKLIENTIKGRVGCESFSGTDCMLTITEKCKKEQYKENN